MNLSVVYSRELLSWKASPHAQAANVLLWMLLAVPWALPARAQSHARPTFALAVQVDAAAAGGAECWKAELLRRRVLHYANESERHADLRVELDVEAEGDVALRLLRAGRLLAQRRLTHLPKRCADRRDTVALSIALALEHAPAEDPPAPARAAMLATTPTPSSGSLARSDGSTSAPGAEAHGQASATAQSAGTAQGVPEAAAPASAAVPAQRASEASPTSQPLKVAKPRSAERVAARARAPETEHGGPALLHLHLGGRWLVNASPSSVFAATAGLELPLPRALSLDLSGFVSSAGEARFARGIAQTRLLGGELLGCRAWALGDVGLQGCVGATVAACRADGRDYPVGEPTKTLLWVAGQAGIALRWPRATTVALRFLLLGHVNVVRPELQVQGSEAPLTPGWVGGSIGLELVVTLQ